MVDESGTGEHEPRDGRGVRARLSIIVVAVVVASALIGGGALIAASLSMLRSVDPAERLPASAAFYVDINLHPGDDSTAMVSDVLNGLGLDGFSADLEDGIDDLLGLIGVEDVEPRDLARWIGTRGAVAVYDDGASGDDDGVLALAIASRNDRLARKTLAAISDATTEGFGYVVDDGMAVLTIGNRHPQARADEIVAAGRAAPMAEHEPFRAGLERFGGDYFATAWIDMQQASTFTDDLPDDEISMSPDLVLPGNAEFVDISTVMGTDPVVIGVTARPGVIEAHFTAGHRDGGPGRPDWLDRLSEAAAAEVALTVTLSDDLGEPGEGLTQWVGDLYNAPLPFLDEYERGMWDYDLALSDDELEEYRNLDRQWATGTLPEDDPDFDRLVDLEDAYWTYGLQNEYDHAVEMGWLESYFSVRALSRDEYYELLRIEFELDTPGVNEIDEDWYYKAIRRLYAYGVESDYEWYEPDVDAEQVADQLLDYLSGITITAVANDLNGDSGLGLAAEVADGRADRLHQLPRPFLHDLFEFLEASPRFDGSRVVFSELDGAEGVLSDHPRFAEAFDGMPNEAVLAMFIDVRAINADDVVEGDGHDDISVMSLVYGTDGTGMLRVLIDADSAQPVTAGPVNWLWYSS